MTVAKSAEELSTHWSRILLDNLTITPLVSKFPEFCETRKIITMYTKARHRSLS